jgi:hypothetical protein
MMPRTGLLALSVVLAGTLACSQQSSGVTQIQPVGQPPIGGITDTAVVPVGVVVGFIVTSSASQDSSSGTATVTDPRVASLVATVEPGVFVLVGQSPGQTTLTAWTSTTDKVTMPVVVEAQDPAP